MLPLQLAAPPRSLEACHAHSALLRPGAGPADSQLVIPKYHGEKLTDIPDEYLHDILPIARKVAAAVAVDNFNILQNNGALAHQVGPWHLSGVNRA